MSDKTKEEPLTIEAKWDISYRHAAGPHAERFLNALRDDKQILGVKCPDCSRVFVPPRAFCERCFVATTEWVPVAEEGTVETMTIQYMGFPGLPETPYAVGIVKLDGADSSMLAFLGGLDLSDAAAAEAKIGAGCRVKARWKDEREGRVTDIAFFEPA